MNKSLVFRCLFTGAGLAIVAGCSTWMARGAPTTFFITSTNPGNAGNLGGLAGADAHCERLASAAGIGGRNWRAYLSTQAKDGTPAVNARDRIGKGPWVNAKGQLIAKDIDELHSNNAINAESGLTETGEVVPYRPAYPVNKHDMLTGSAFDGRALPPGRDATCSNWTSSSTGGAMVGHFNRGGTNPDPVANASWNSSHMTPGCDMASLERVGGAGLLYCFAAR